MKILNLAILWVLLSAIWVSAQSVSQSGLSVAYQINPAHSGSIKSIGLTPPLKVKWSVSLNGTASYPLILPSEIVVIDGGNNNHPSTLEALNPDDGSLLWSQPSPSTGWIGAAYDNGMVFVANTNGTMAAFSATDGHQIWSEPLPFQYSFSSPVTALHGFAYTGGAGEGGTVYGVKESNGGVVWTAGVENGDSSAPAIQGDAVYVSYVCPQTYRFQAKTGQPIWSYSGGCEGGGGETAVVYKDLLYVRDLYNYPTDGITLSTTTGELVGGFNSKYAPAFAGSRAFYTETDSLTAVDLKTGSTLWSVAPPTGSLSCSPVVVNGIVYTGTSTGYLVGYSAKKGGQEVSMNLGQAISCGEYFPEPQVGMGAGQGLLVVPAGTELFALE